MSEDELTFDDDEQQSPKNKPQTPPPQEKMNIFEEDDNDDEMNSYPTPQKPTTNNNSNNSGKKTIEKTSSPGVKKYSTEYDNSDNSDIDNIFGELDSDDEDDRRRSQQKSIEKTKAISREKTMRQTKAQQSTSARKAQQPKEKQQSSDRKRTNPQNNNSSSAQKKSGFSQNNNNNSLNNSSNSKNASNDSNKPLIDEATKIKVSEQSKNVQVGYEKKEALTQLTRSVLETADLRNFHNWIKSVIIKKYSDAMKQTIKIKEDLRETKGQLFVMELACGQGGDLKKWLHADIALYVGVDISFNSLKEASRRTKDIMERLPPQQNYKKFKYGFYQKDGSAPKEEFWKFIHEQDLDRDKNKRFYFDLVSCQMAMHYMFGSEQHARNFFENATSRLNNYGYLLLTFSDANSIVKKMRSRSKFDSNLNKHVFGNKYFSMAFDSLNFPFNKPYGHKYEFYLADAVGEKDEETGQIKYTPEYLVETNNLLKLALEYQLEAKENLNFIEFFKKYGNEHLLLLKQMGLDRFNADHPSIDPELWEISHCYRIVVFQKIDITEVNNKKYSFVRNPNFKTLSQEPIPINFVPQHRSSKH